MAEIPTLPDNPVSATTRDTLNEGISLREYMATQALNAVVSNPSWNSGSLAFAGVERPFDGAAKIAVAYADALIEALNRGV